LMAYRAVDTHVAARVRHFLRQRHKLSTQGTRSIPSDFIFNSLGVLRLRDVHLHARS